MDENMLIKHILPREFYHTNAITLARSLLGKVLVCRNENGTTAGIISETEAYMGVIDKASHAYNGRRTARTETMYLPGGFAYVYLIYGIYSCMNITANEEDNPEAVLIRGVVPFFGFERMLENTRIFAEARKTKHPFREDRYRKNPRILTDGPGKLCSAMGIDRSYDKTELVAAGRKNEIFVADIPNIRLSEITESGRIGIDYAEEAALFPWRYTANIQFEPPTTVDFD